MDKVQVATQTLESFYKLHDKVALLFSGGKDSLTALYLCKPWWDKTVIAWVNTGANFPEVVKFVEHIRRMVPHFVEIKSNATEFVHQHGFPSEVVAISNTDLGTMVQKPHGNVRMCSKFECCEHNLWRPILQFMKTTDATGIIKAQKHGDTWTAPFVEKINLEGKDLSLVYPIAEFNDDDVRDYLRSQFVDVDDRLNLTRSSMDCWFCTGYWKVLGERLRYMDRYHPSKAVFVRQKVAEIRSAIAGELNNLGDI